MILNLRKVPQLVLFVVCLPDEYLGIILGAATSKIDYEACSLVMNPKHNISLAALMLRNEANQTYLLKGPEGWITHALVG